MKMGNAKNLIAAMSAVAISCLFAENAFLADAQLIFHKTLPSYAALYSRISTNDNSVVFWVETVQEPVVRQEWRVSGPEYRWTVSPGKIGRNLPSTMDSRSEMMWFDIASDFGKSYTVRVDVKWTAIHENGQTQTSQSEFSFDVDAIRYDFDMACAGGIKSKNNDPLVDNRPANVIIEAQGCSRLNLLDLDMGSNAVKSKPLNKAGTGMDFQKTGPLSFRVSKTFWYGELQPGCCYTNSNPYRVWLEVDNRLECEKNFTVGFLDEEDTAFLDVFWPEYAIGVPEQVGGGKWRVSVEIGEFPRTTAIITNDTSQYAAESQREELFHREQFKGSVAVSQGGTPDLYDVRQVYESIGIFSMTNRFVLSEQGESAVAFQQRVAMLVEQKIQDEIDDSNFLFDHDKAFRESRAKIHAGYNAAFKYHCTYESKFGLEQNLSPRGVRPLAGAWQ